MYTREEWQRVSNNYAERLRSIEIPEDASPAAIMQLQAALDALHTESQLDYARLKGEADKLKSMVKRLKTAYYLEVKDQGKTEKEREALAQKLISERHPYAEMDIMEALELIEEEATFMQTVTDMIQEKTRRLITILGSLKLEQSIASLENSAETVHRRSHIA